MAQCRSGADRRCFAVHRIVGALVVSLITAPALAQPRDEPAGNARPGPHLREDIAESYFNDRKAHALRMIERRIAIASTAHACVLAATFPAQLRACLLQQRAAIEELEEQARASPR